LASSAFFIFAAPPPIPPIPAIPHGLKARNITAWAKGLGKTPQKIPQRCKRATSNHPSNPPPFPSRQPIPPRLNLFHGKGHTAQGKSWAANPAAHYLLGHNAQMKIIPTSLFSLLLGIAIGWYAGFTKPTAKYDRYAQQEMQKMENEGALSAIYATRAIEMIQAGETQKAVYALSFPIADYYVIRSRNSGTNETRLRIRSEIEALASTNMQVAAQIKATSSNYWVGYNSVRSP